MRVSFKLMSRLDKGLTESNKFNKLEPRSMMSLGDLSKRLRRELPLTSNNSRDKLSVDKPRLPPTDKPREPLQVVNNK